MNIHAVTYGIEQASKAFQNLAKEHTPSPRTPLRMKLYDYQERGCVGKT
jgi:hypothetical protein